MRLCIEIEGESETRAQLPPLPGDGADLVAFMSFAVARGFGAQHPLIALADRLHDSFGVRLGPLTTFYEADIDDREDEEKLELAWQDVGPLEGSLDAITAVLESDQLSQALLKRAGAAKLREQVAALANSLRAHGGDQVRLSYSL
jgi:hypothetical protein